MTIGQGLENVLGTGFGTGVGLSKELPFHEWNHEALQRQQMEEARQQRKTQELLREDAMADRELDVTPKVNDLLIPDVLALHEDTAKRLMELKKEYPHNYINTPQYNQLKKQQQMAALKLENDSRILNDYSRNYDVNKHVLKPEYAALADIIQRNDEEGYKDYVKKNGVPSTKLYENIYDDLKFHTAYAPTLKYNQIEKKDIKKDANGDITYLEVASADPKQLDFGLRSTWEKNKAQLPQHKTYEDYNKYAQDFYPPKVTPKRVKSNDIEYAKLDLARKNLEFRMNGGSTNANFISPSVTWGDATKTQLVGGGWLEGQEGAGMNNIPLGKADVQVLEGKTLKNKSIDNTLYRVIRTKSGEIMIEDDISRSDPTKATYPLREIKNWWDGVIVPYSINHNKSKSDLYLNSLKRWYEGEYGKTFNASDIQPDTFDGYDGSVYAMPTKKTQSTNQNRTETPTKKTNLAPRPK